MSAASALDELRRKKRCLERAIRELERLQQCEEGPDVQPEEILPFLRTGTSNLLVMRRRS